MTAEALPEIVAHLLYVTTGVGFGWILAEFKDELSKWIKTLKK